MISEAFQKRLEEMRAAEKIKEENTPKEMTDVICPKCGIIHNVTISSVRVGLLKDQIRCDCGFNSTPSDFIHNIKLPKFIPSKYMFGEAWS